MNFDSIEEKQKLYQHIKANLSHMEQQNEDSVFAIEFTHDSTALEGNTLSLSETKSLLEDGIVPDGGKELRELYEVINHAKAFDFIKERVNLGLSTDEECVKGIHKIVTDRILQPFSQGEYRRNNVRIQGAINIPPRYEKVEREMNRFFETHKQKSIEVHPIEKAAWTHAEFVRIHPFVDGNGRTARLLLNYELMQEGFPAITIKKNKEDRNRYMDGLQEYSTYGNLEPFTELIKDKVERQLDFYISHFNNHLEENQKQQKVLPKTIQEFDKLQRYNTSTGN